MLWTVTPGNNPSNVCGAVNDVIQIGDPEQVQTVSNGGTYKNVPVTVNCSVSPNSTGYSVTASADYGNQGSLTISGQINVTAGSAPGPQQNITGAFNDHVANGLIASMNSNSCTITFTKNGNMGIAPTRIWGVIDCPQDTAANGTVCDGNAEFLFQNCAQ